jgi:hypothetical protein
MRLLSKKTEGLINVAADADQELVRRSQKGDLRAFEMLVERYQKKMINLAFRMTGNYEEAFDVVQDCFPGHKKIPGRGPFFDLAQWYRAQSDPKPSETGPVSHTVSTVVSG